MISKKSHDYLEKKVFQIVPLAKVDINNIPSSNREITPIKIVYRPILSFFVKNEVIPDIIAMSPKKPKINVEKKSVSHGCSLPVSVQCCKEERTVNPYKTAINTAIANIIEIKPNIECFFFSVISFWRRADSNFKIYMKRAIAIITPIIKVNPINPKIKPTTIAIIDANSRFILNTSFFRGDGFGLEFAINIRYLFFSINIFGGNN